MVGDVGVAWTVVVREVDGEADGVGDVLEEQAANNRRNALITILNIF